MSNLQFIGGFYILDIRGTEREKVAYYVKGDEKKLLTFRDSVEEFLDEIESCRIKETYKHRSCTGTFGHG